MTDYQEIQQDLRDSGVRVVKPGDEPDGKPKRTPRTAQDDVGYDEPRTYLKEEDIRHFEDADNSGEESSLSRFWSHPEESDPELLVQFKEYMSTKYKDEYEPGMLSGGDLNWLDEDVKVGFVKYLKSEDTPEEFEAGEWQRTKAEGRVQRKHQVDERARLKAEKKKRDEEGWHGVVHIDLIPQILEKFATDEEKTAITKFLNLMAGRGAPVLWAGFDVGRSKANHRIEEISGMSLVTKEDGKMDRTTIPAHLVRKVFSYVTASRRPGANTDTGLKFINSVTSKAFAVYPDMNPDEVAGEMKKVRINDETFPDKVKFFVGNDFQREK